jgi:hypothetical protein
MEVALLLVIALLAANLPFLVERLFFIKTPASGNKHLGWRMLELVVMYFVVGGIGLLLEKKGGDIHSQNWEFYAITASLFLVFAFPGFIYRYLWRKKGT